MTKSRPIGITILIVLHFLFIFGYISVLISGALMNTDLHKVQRLLGFIMFLCNIASLYFLIKPSPFGWKFILGYILLSVLNILMQRIFFEITVMYDGPYDSRWERFMNIGFTLIVSALYFWYIYKKKDYFHGTTRAPGREDLLDDEEWL